ncbi:MAG: serine hydrolase domain-containing protein, partial [Gammaproteobacteria bacterium]
MKTPSCRRHFAVALWAFVLPAISMAQTENPADWMPTPEGLRRMADYFPSATVARGADAYELSWGDPIPQNPSGGLDLEAFNLENGSMGMIVLHRGRIVYEGYWQGADAESIFNSWSMAKSITGTLIDLAEGDGFIESIEDPIVRYVPELAETAYRDVTVEQALQMSSGVHYEEAENEIQLTCLALPPGPLFADCDAVRAEFGNLEGFVLSLDQRAAPPGTTFNYSTAETQVLGWVLQNATGQSPAEYLSEKIWQPLGMEADAKWLTDPASGLPLAGL